MWKTEATESGEKSAQRKLVEIGLNVVLIGGLLLGALHIGKKYHLVDRFSPIAGDPIEKYVVKQQAHELNAPRKEIKKLLHAREAGIIYGYRVRVVEDVSQATMLKLSNFFDSGVVVVDGIDTDDNGKPDTFVADVTYSSSVGPRDGEKPLDTMHLVASMAITGEKFETDLTSKTLRDPAVQAHIDQVSSGLKQVSTEDYNERSGMPFATFVLDKFLVA